MPKIKTRILILSDTHAAFPRRPLPEADLALHCGDLTFNSQPEEYKTTFTLLRSIKAPLKLAIPGNHDTCLDPIYWATKRRLRYRNDDGDTYPSQARAIADAARREANVLLLEEQGTQTFVLRNGAKISVFTSPWTPRYGGWGFQYKQGTHEFEIPEGVDVAMTHGPAWRQLDEARKSEHAGCPALLRGLEKGRPRVHCCGHIHEAWGAKVVRWAERGDDGGEEEREPTGLVDEKRSRVIERLSDQDDEEEEGNFWKTAAGWIKKDGKPQQPGHRTLKIGGDDGMKLTESEETLFINAAIMDVRYHAVQLPWLIELELEEATEEDKRNAVPWDNAKLNLATLGEKKAEKREG